MCVRTFLVSVLLFSILLPARGQQTNRQPPAPPTQESTPIAQRRSASQVDNEEVVRITTNLVQVDAVVTDKSGNQVSDLKPEEFEILEDGRPRQITNFSYVLNEPTTLTAGRATGPALRQLRRDMTPGYAFYIYNARLGQDTRPSLKMQMRLLRDGKQVYTSGEKPLVFDQISDPNRLLVTSRLMPDERLPPGEYGLQIVVTDLLAKGQHTTVTQSIDFEIMK